MHQTFDDSAKLEFLNGAKAAYEMIVTSFAKGDKNVLKPLLNKISSVWIKLLNYLI